MNLVAPVKPVKPQSVGHSGGSVDTLKPFVFFQCVTGWKS